MMKSAFQSGICLLLILTGLVWGGLQKDNKASNEVLEQGRKVYHANCAECHGPQGRGDGPKAHQLGFHPRDFALGAFKCRCTQSGQLPTDEDLMRILANGMPGTPMRPYANLSLQDRQAVVEYVKTFSPKFAAGPQPKCDNLLQPVPSTEKTVFEGRQIYRILGCWQCHGSKGRGDGPAAANMTDDWGKPIKAYNFTVAKRFKCGGDERDLYRTLMTGMNGSPMPSYREALTFAADSVSDFKQYEGTYGANELNEIMEYLRQQPTAADIKAMSAGDRNDLAEKRAWALVHYLESMLGTPAGESKK